ncbi:hypothetical protein C8A03DRAFT_20027, partial [Achaetomium macrosporum]
PLQFSPAELQGFLLKRKKAPRRALAEVENWAAGMVAQKARGGKLSITHNCPRAVTMQLNAI